MSNGWNIAVLGATGAVGSAILELLVERQFPVGELYLLASENSAGENIRFNSQSYLVTEAETFDWSQAQLAFFVAGAEATARYADLAAESGCILIDSSGLYAMEPEVPLVIASVNPHHLADYRSRNIISLPDSLVSQLLCAIEPLREFGGFSRLQVTNLMSVSNYGNQAVQALAGESARLLSGVPGEGHYFKQQLAFNVLSESEDEHGSMISECRLVDQVRKILQDEGIPISASSALTPVFYGNTQLVQVETLSPLSAEQVREQLSQSAEIHVSQEGDIPNAVEDATATGSLCIGAIRQDYGSPEQIKFWSVADNIRFSGALMAITLAERLVEEYLSC